MTQQDPVQQLVMLCHKLQKEGVPPTIAMLRAKAPFTVSVTQAIEAVKAFKGSRQVPTQDDPPARSESGQLQAMEKRIVQLEEAVALLEQRLAQVLAKPE